MLSAATCMKLASIYTGLSVMRLVTRFLKGHYPFTDYNDTRVLYSACKNNL